MRVCWSKSSTVSSTARKHPHRNPSRLVAWCMRCMQLDCMAVRRVGCVTIDQKRRYDQPGDRETRSLRMWSDRHAQTQWRGQAEAAAVPTFGEVPDLGHELHVWCQSCKTSRQIEITSALWTRQFAGARLRCQRVLWDGRVYGGPAVDAAVSARRRRRQERQSPLRAVRATVGNPRDRPQISTMVVADRRAVQLPGMRRPS